MSHKREVPTNKEGNYIVLGKIVRIDEEKCTGCGQCIQRCAEGALRMVNGKARLLKEVYCDGLGACLGQCPTGAIEIVERDTEAFDEEVRKHPDNENIQSGGHELSSARFTEPPQSPSKSMLSNWPVQLMLVPPQAACISDADLIISADCAPFTYPDFHKDFLVGKSLLIGCPKLDDIEFYKERLTQIFRFNRIRSVMVVNMEVPCCFGLYQTVRQAVVASGKSIPIRQEIISVKGMRASA